jgi:hypothetical protein
MEVDVQVGGRRERGQNLLEVADLFVVISEKDQCVVSILDDGA